MAPPDGLQISPDPAPDEAAAIAAAIEAMLAAESPAADGRAPEAGWAGRRFAFAGRLAKLTDEPARVPDGAPTDPWAAAGRVERW